MKFYAYEPENGIEYFETEKEAKEKAEEMLEDYRDMAVDGWDDCVNDLSWGTVNERCYQTSCKKAPEDSEFDEIWEFDLVKEK